MTVNEFLDELCKSLHEDNGTSWRVEQTTKSKIFHHSTGVQAEVDHGLFSPLVRVFMADGTQIPVSTSKGGLVAAHARSWHDRHCERERAKRQAAEQRMATALQRVLDEFPGF